MIHSHPSSFEGKVRSSVFDASYIFNFVTERYDLDIQTVGLFSNEVNLMYHVRTSETAYIFRISPKRQYIEREHIPIEEQSLFEVEVLLHLAEQGIAANVPIAMKDGQYLGRIEAPEGDRFFVMLSFVGGRHKTFTEMSEEEALGFGKYLASMHQALDGFSSTNRSYQLELEDLVRPTMTNLSEQYGEMYPEDVAFLNDFGERLMQKLQGFNLPRSGFGVIHADVHWGNFHNTDEGQIVGLDFDFVCYGWRLLDLAGHLIFQRMFSSEEQQEKVERIAELTIEGYDSVKQLSDVERKAIPYFSVVRLFKNLEANLWFTKLKAYPADVNSFHERAIKYLRSMDDQMLIIKK